ncbi:YhcH/YjgK/YiaL family protein [Paenibacillus sp. GYB003]|uniref:YhcH/YjgK/YiaL family protein n=1 Tax=Paenibacillus sp. GYB003 TaxID=2994392 RepID=UPI002F965678
MITDTLANIGQYASVSPRLKLAAQFLETRNCRALEPGKYEIDGERVYALVQHYDTKPQEKGLWEAHRQYLDVQYMAEGSERLGYVPIGQTEVTHPYDETGDYALFAASGDFFTLREGHFALFAPHDVHMPGIRLETARAVKKIVIKVLIEP